MRIAITSTVPNLEGEIDPRFGRCQYFLIVDTDTLQFEAIENANISRGGGAGIQSAQLVAEKGIEAVITGNCGPNAFQTLTAAGITVVTGISGGSIKEAIEEFRSGEFSPAGEATVGSHYGLSTGGNPKEKEENVPRGDGTGRGMGQGGGRGRGGGVALGPGGDCVCPSCAKTVLHQRGVPCYQIKCPDCGIPMTRQR